MALFAGFASHDVDVDGVGVHAVVGGSGPPLLLLHGYPQTHVMWHALAPWLAAEFTVVAADLRGYGNSARPAAGSDHAGYSKRAMAADQVGLMERLGHREFGVAGHDRGARVAHRMCRDHPSRITRAAVLDVVPTRFVYEQVDRALAEAYYHWFFLSQPPELPERLIGGDPEYFLRCCLSSWSRRDGAFCDEAVAEYVRHFCDPATITATCEDYRAGASIDLEHDRADPAPVRCPLLVLWGGEGFVGQHYDPLAVWRELAADPALVGGAALACGHFLPEEAPEETYRALREFFLP
ncbi:MAG: alpha/beta hydrolase [Pseudonocardiales bacterium]|nr:alpha/beta hydrolase [Pseudonocardiales bacterium]